MRQVFSAPTPQLELHAPLADMVQSKGRPHQDAQAHAVQVTLCHSPMRVATLMPRAEGAAQTWEETFTATMV